jgi:hypothetical protein
LSTVELHVAAARFNTIANQPAAALRGYNLPDNIGLANFQLRARNDSRK